MTYEDKFDNLVSVLNILLYVNSQGGAHERVEEEVIGRILLIDGRGYILWLREMLSLVFSFSASAVCGRACWCHGSRPRAVVLGLGETVLSSASLLPSAELQFPKPSASILITTILSTTNICQLLLPSDPSSHSQTERTASYMSSLPPSESQATSEWDDSVWRQPGPNFSCSLGRRPNC